MSSLEVVARHYGMTVRKSGGSHFVFLHSRSEFAVSIPFRRPIKPIYIAQFLAWSTTLVCTDLNRETLAT